MHTTNSNAVDPLAELRVPHIRREDVDSAEWQARVDLAAAHRIIDIYGWTNLIYNHATLRVPGQPDFFLVKPHNLLFNEVKASNLLKLRIDGKMTTEAENVNTAGFTIHTAVLQARSDLNSTVHVHTEVGMAMSAHDKGLLPINQGAMRFYNRLSYHAYEGMSKDLDERESIASDLGPSNKAMIMYNHGLLTGGSTMVEALTSMLYLITSCRTQLLLEATGSPIRIPSPEICEHAALQWEAIANFGTRDEWPAYLRMADRVDTSYRD
ncbi:class II aldolase/adducin family protein [Ottowia thiooxydans]|uniref:class II aldolase/adducin family protein n=1 Tax=Ottowia thiooxydans TaxID=219182 RepID=UPI00040EB1C0|nr:class II aldolase/adducin family protein [Ottowia thiooxydans]